MTDEELDLMIEALQEYRTELLRVAIKTPNEELRNAMYARALRAQELRTKLLAQKATPQAAHGANTA